MIFVISLKAQATTSTDIAEKNVQYTMFTIIKLKCSIQSLSHIFICTQRPLISTIEFVLWGRHTYPWYFATLGMLHAFFSFPPIADLLSLLLCLLWVLLLSLLRTPSSLTWSVGRSRWSGRPPRTPPSRWTVPYWAAVAWSCWSVCPWRRWARSWSEQWMLWGYNLCQLSIRRMVAQPLQHSRLSKCVCMPPSTGNALLLLWCVWISRQAVWH